MTSSNEMSVFAHTIMSQKYSHTKIDGSKETWPEIAYRVAKNVLSAVYATDEQIAIMIETRNAPKDWQQKNLQLVIQFNVVANSPASSRVIASHCW